MDIDRLPKYIQDLDQARNRYALRIPKGSASKILKHRHAPAFLAFLELKPLFVCSVILNDGGRIPYDKIAQFLRLSNSGTRAKIRTLKRYKLIKVDRDNNLHLGTYKRFRQIIKHEGKYNYKFLNNGETKEVLRATAVNENLEKQKYVVFKKILVREFINEYARNSANANTFLSLKNLECPDKLITKHHARKWKKIVRTQWDYLIKKWERVYNAQMQSDAPRPDVNPEITLSCRGIARVLGRKSPSTGFYQAKKMHAAGLLTSEAGYIHLPEKCGALYAAMFGMRPDVFSYEYPTRLNRTGYERKYFRRCTNLIETRINTIFF